MTQMQRDARTGILTYLACTFALSSIFYTLIIRAGHLAAGGGLYVLGLMWCPGVSAMLTCLILRRPLSSLGWRWKWRYQWMSYVIPIAYATATYVVIWALGFGGVPNWAFVEKFAAARHFAGSRGMALALYVAMSLTLGMVLSVTSALGEEIGWRGFLVPELAKTTTFTKTALISGAIWTSWHVPILVFADYNNGTPAWYGLTCFAVMVIGVSFAFAWMRLRSGSLWTGAFLHASHNMVIQSILTPLTLDTGITKWVIDEFGCGLAIAAIVVAFLFWRKRHDVERAPDASSAAPAVSSPRPSARETALRVDASSAARPRSAAG
jgi:membrane protease YdiL (CAAX protease family)